MPDDFFLLVRGVWGQVPVCLSAGCVVPFPVPGPGPLLALIPIFLGNSYFIEEKRELYLIVNFRCLEHFNVNKM